MVRHFIPQGANSSIDTNTNNPPQGFVPGGVIPPPTVDFEIFDESGVQGSIIFDDGVETGFVLVKES